MNAFIHSESGEPAWREGAVAVWKTRRLNECDSVMSSEKRVSFRGRERFGGYDWRSWAVVAVMVLVLVGSRNGGGGDGCKKGMVEDGFGDVRAYTRAAA